VWLPWISADQRGPGRTASATGPSSRAESRRKRNRRRPMSVAGTSPPRCTHGLSGRPERGKAQGSTVFAESTGDKRLARTGQSPEGEQRAHPHRPRNVESLQRVWFGPAAGAPTKINRGGWCSTPTTCGHPSRRTRTELSGRSKSCEGRNPMSGAGSRAKKTCPPRRPGGEIPTERDRNARLNEAESAAPGRMSQGLIGRRFERRWMDSIAW